MNKPLPKPLLRKRFEKHNPFNEQVKRDWIAAIKQDPDRFDALLYLPIVNNATLTEKSFYEPDDVESIDPTQQTLTYTDPVLVSVVDCPDDSAEFRQMNNSDATLGESDQPLILRIAAESVAKGSMLEWLEETPNGDRLVAWYVHSIFSVATNGAGVLFSCIPCRNFEAPKSLMGMSEKTADPDKANLTHSEPLDETMSNLSSDAQKAGGGALMLEETTDLMEL